jgi:hypothetical protein
LLHGSQVEGSTLKHFGRRLTAGLLLALCCAAQERSTAPSKPTERILGTVTAVDRAGHTVTAKEDKTGTEYTVQLAETRTLLKVDPGAKDLKNAARITADDLAIGDRVEIGGSKAPDNPNSIAARSVILMSARELAQAHEAQAAAWQRSTPGVVTAVDTAGRKLNVTARTPQGTKPVVVDASKAELTRYSPVTPKTAVPSHFAEIQAGDQVRIIGDWGTDGSSMTAQRIYSSSFRTVVGTVTSIARDGKEITIKNLQTKQPLTVTLKDDSAVRRLPPMLAYALARRFDPDFRPPQGSGPGAGPGSAGGTAQPNAEAASGNRAQAGPATEGNPAPGEQGEEAARVNHRTQVAGPGATGGRYAMRGAANGDLSQILDRLPKISATDLKPGDAVVISGSPEPADKSHLLATNVIAGVEPIFQSASPRQAQSLGDWGASLGGGGLDAGAGMPGGGPPQ